MEFPENLVDEYDKHINFKKHINEWYNKYIEGIKVNNKEEVNTIWCTKKVHRDRAHEKYIKYRGQFKLRNDEILNEIRFCLDKEFKF